MYVVVVVEQDLLHQELLAVGKDRTTGLGYAHHSQTCAQTETCMRFGIHSIHPKRQAESLWSRLCRVLNDT